MRLARPAVSFRVFGWSEFDEHGTAGALRPARAQEQCEYPSGRGQQRDDVEVVCVGLGGHGVAELLVKRE